MKYWILGLLCLLPLLPALANAQEDPAFTQEDPEIFYLDMFLERYDLDSTIDAITYDYEEFYLNLEQLSQTLRFTLSVDYKNRRISGWYIKQQNLINLSFSELGNQGASWVTFEGQLYLSTKKLTDIFALTAKINTIKSVAIISTHEQHPMMAKLSRSKEYRKIILLNELKVNYPVHPDQFQMVTPPNIAFRYSKLAPLTDQTSSQQRVSLDANGDILKHAVTLSLNRGDSSKAHLNAHKNIHWLNTKYRYELGDVRPITLPGIPVGGRGAGIRFAINGAEQESNRRRFEGYATPGWDAELYQNGRLVAFQVIGDDGKYIFDNMPISFGFNRFTVKLYGGYGEIKNVPYEFFGLDKNILPGQITPEISVVNSARTVLFNQSEENTNNLITRFNYGINHWSAARISAAQLSTKDQEKEGVIGAGWTALLPRSRLDLDWFKGDTEINKSAAFLSSLWQGDFSVNWRDKNILAQASTQIDANYSRTFETLRWGLSAAQIKTDLERTNTYALQFSYNSDYLQHTHNLLFSRTANSSTTDTLTTNGSTTDSSTLSSRHNANFRLGRFTFQGELKLALDQPQKFDKASIQVRTNINGLAISSGFSQDLFTGDNNSDNNNRSNNNLSNKKFDDKKTFDLKLTQKTRFGRWGLGFANDFSGERTISLNFSTDIGFDSRSPASRQASSIHTTVFHDTNYNGVFDENDKPLQGVRFSGRHHWKHYQSDAVGKVRLPGANSSQLQLIELDKNSLPDPFLHAKHLGFQVKTHAGGANHVTFPLWRTVEVEGFLVRKNKIELNNNNTNQPPLTALPGVKISLATKEGKPIVRASTEYDGFFVFDHVLPGEYCLKVEGRYLKKKILKFEHNRCFEVSENSKDYIDLKDVVLVQGEYQQ